jgi:hypothetical protein
MKKFILGALALISFAVFSAFQGTDGPACDQKVLKDKAKKALDPYKYDSAKLTKITYKKKESVKEVEVPLFLGEKYRFVFNTETLKTLVVINVYNKDKESKNRKLLFTTKDAPSDKREHVWEHGRSTKVYVDYDVPAGDSTSVPGCVLFMLGYK